MSNRRLSRTVVTAMAIVAVALGSWLLVADPSLGRGGGPAAGDRDGGRFARPGAPRAQAQLDVAQPQSHGYGGYSGVCRRATWRPLSSPEEFIRKGTVRCFESNGNRTGDNPDLSQEAFVSDLVSGQLTNLTKDVRRCVEGPNEGQPCPEGDVCPQGSCQDMHVQDCASDGRGRLVFFIFDGNPTGGNADMGDELFSYDLKHGQLTQVTTQRGWCRSDVNMPCDKSSDCGTTGACARNRMSGLEVSSDGKVVWFLSDGDAGDNAGHAITQYANITRGKGRGLRAVGAADNYCSENTANRRQPCAKDEDCGAVCGDGQKDPTEQCDSFRYGGGQAGCPSGQYCVRPSRPNQCTCQTPVCGNNILEPGEFCDGPGRCGTNFTCNSTCTSCVAGSPSGAFL